MAPSSSSGAATSVQVALRIRPPTNQDSTSIPSRFQRSVLHATSSTSVSVDPTSGPPNGGPSPAVSAASAAAAGKKQVFSFDMVHGPPTTQHEMFVSTAYPMISRFLEGFNCTILAYGQTSSGKTHTMTGIDLDSDPSDPNNGMGIIPRSVSTIFTSARQLREDRAGAWTYTIKASFIEIYNEDLIDLLVDDNGGVRREVQIREDKDGHIIWGGLREVTVKNPAEVLTLIRKGSSIRRTNETDMNAQSSRSHAIFSLTLIQKKFAGSGPPPRSSSPLPANGRSPSRLARPGSMYAGGPSSRVASPTGGRPSTPSFASAMNRGSGLRPSSAMGHNTERASVDDGDGEWVTITSKFHFVDLAGSERLKRTAAAGERVKEGISINSGLLALGNVISALGDPSRAKTHMSHVPYRDSKLTRLLQDSLGGNAHTLMIACVSPAEWNANETINTLKYANRARNIKNNAVVNAKEDGWDDVEWLQGTVRRLRTELKSLKDGGSISIPVAAPESNAVEGAGKKVLAQMTELQNNYEDLREKFVERTEELTRLRRELGERHRGSTGGAIPGTGKYEEIVGPVIEEYEKTISAMEAELTLNRAALRHTNEMVEEKEDELSAITERHSATELYVEELRARVAKLTEREASTEAYVRDLEEKMKSYDETSITSSESMTDLKREVIRYRDSEAHSAKYIADLEARLARTDESVLALQQTIEKLESECDRRRDEVQQLQSRLEALRNDGDNWRHDLEDREKKVRELEEKMQEWEARKQEAADARVRLGAVVDEVATARKSLELNVVNGHPHVNGASTPDDAETPLASAVPGDAEEKQTIPSPAVIAESSKEIPENSAAERQLLALQQTHTATLADLSSMTDKYRDALREISDLAAQIQEAKLSGSSAEPVPPESPTTVETPVERPLDHSPGPYRRRMTGGRSRESSMGEPQINSAGRRLFFRQAASAESLHARSLSQSQSLSQELSSAHSRKTSFSTSSSHSPSNSYSSFLAPHSRPNLSITLPPPVMSPGLNERSVSSLEKEIMRLQEVLKEREAEIAVLEVSLKESQTLTHGDATAISANGTAFSGAATEPVASPGSASSPTLADLHLSPKTISQFDNIRKIMNHEPPRSATSDSESDPNDRSVFSEPDESLERLNELMLSMAAKESAHREIVDSLNTQLAQVRRQHDDLTALSRDQASNMSTEIEVLQTKHSDVVASLEQAKEREAELVDSLDKAVQSHQVALEQLATQLDEARTAHDAAVQQHAKQMQERETAASEVLADVQKQHESAVNRLASEHAEALKQKEAQASAALQTTEEEYYNALTKLRADHAAQVETHSAETAAALDRLREEHASQLRIAEIAREGSLSESQSSKDLALKELQDAHAAAVATKEASFAEELKDLKTEHSRALTTKEEDHALEMDKLRSSHDGLLAKLKEEWRVEAEQLNSALAAIKEESSQAAARSSSELEKTVQSHQEGQAALLNDIEQSHVQELAKLEADHKSALGAASTKAEEAAAALVASHALEMASLKTQHEESITELNNSIAEMQTQHQDALEGLRTRHEQALSDERNRLNATLEQLKLDHAKEIETLRKDRDLLAKEIDSHRSASEQTRRAHQRTMTEEKTAHEQSLAEKTSWVTGLESQLSTMGAELAEKTARVSGLESQLSAAGSERAEFEARVSALQAELEQAKSDHSGALEMKQFESEHQLTALRAELDQAKSEHSSSRGALDSDIAALQLKHSESDARVTMLEAELERVKSDHSSAQGALDTDLAALQAKHSESEARAAALEAEVAEHSSARGVLDSDLAALQDKHAASEARTSALESELEQIKSEHSSSREALEAELEQLRMSHSQIGTERDHFESEMMRLRAELDRTRNEQSALIQEASKRESLVRELEQHQSVLADMQDNLQRVKDEKDVLQTEKSKSESLIRELQAQVLARSSSPPNGRPGNERSYSRSTMPAMKLPPPTPPPSVPPPPAPRTNGDATYSTSSHGSSSRDSQPDSPLTSIGPSLNSVDTSKSTAKIEAQAKQLDEQEVMIKTLNKQLTHCESDLQTHMDLVSTLETSLGDSEKNLRKARMHATELARERDTLNSKLESLRGELDTAKREVVSVRNSVVQEKQSLEQRLDEERKAKERARQQMDMRVDELQRRKSKFSCL
ncbi:unnamed protein product [Mycena citricolor]|uniref:Kinesin motor domain-containing protein n=1 Tax=Mycena citricolor TaxID=2018698 RepID=A0AAD2GXQ5_9AGAR|nr:unnamed protein product [Mycena citricolor]